MTAGAKRSFHSALLLGHEAERDWTERARGFGLAVRHGKKKVAVNHNRFTDHTDTPDAYAIVGIEIKERDLRFTCPADYPYDTVYVDDMLGLSRDAHRPMVYVFLSKATGRWVWLTILDQDDSWKVRETRDGTRGHPMKVLEAPKRFLRPANTLAKVILPERLVADMEP